MRKLCLSILVAGTVVVGSSQTATEATTKSQTKVKLPAAEASAPGAAKKAPKSNAKTDAKTQTKSAEKKDDKKDAKKKEDEVGKIEGLEIARGGNRFLGIQILDGKFKLNFYDDKKKPTPPDVGRAALRWDPKYKLGVERVVLVPGGGPNSLTAEKFIRPPYNFKLTIVLLGEGADGDGAEPTGETHVIDFRQGG